MHRKGQGVFTAFYKKLRIGIRAHRNGDKAMVRDSWKQKQ